MTETLLIVLCILMVFLTGLSIVVSSVAVFVAWRSVTAFLASEAQKDEYTRFLNFILDKVKEDSEIFRLEMVKRIGADIPEMRQLNALLQNLEVSMTTFKKTLQQFVTEG